MKSTIQRPSIVKMPFPHHNAELSILRSDIEQSLNYINYSEIDPYFDLDQALLGQGGWKCPHFKKLVLTLIQEVTGTQYDINPTENQIITTAKLLGFCKLRAPKEMTSLKIRLLLVDFLLSKLREVNEKFPLQKTIEEKDNIIREHQNRLLDLENRLDEEYDLNEQSEEANNLLKQDLHAMQLENEKLKRIIEDNRKKIQKYFSEIRVKLTRPEPEMFNVKNLVKASKKIISQKDNRINELLQHHAVEMTKKQQKIFEQEKTINELNMKLDEKHIEDDPEDE